MSSVIVEVLIAAWTCSCQPLSHTSVNLHVISPLLFHKKAETCGGAGGSIHVRDECNYFSFSIDLDVGLGLLKTDCCVLRGGGTQSQAYKVRHKS